MIWIWVLGIAVACLGVLVFVLKMPRAGWEITGAALLFGLAGYALQSHPGLAGAPKAPVEDQRSADAELLRQRQAMGDKFDQGRDWLVMSDALLRQGQFRAAADFLGNGVKKHPEDADLWVALGNALIGHSGGTISPAAQYALRRAAAINPAHPGPPFFLGLALVQSGRLSEARDVWADLLQRSPPDASWRADLAARLNRLDQLISATDGAAAAPMPPNPTKSAEPER